MPDRICCILPYRYGDSLIALPFAKHWADEGAEIGWVVHEQFADLFDGISYVTAIPYNGPVGDIRAAAKLAEGWGGRLLSLKSLANPWPLDKFTEHFSAEIWQRAGVLEHYHDWPLVIDRRSPERERELINRYLPEGDKPILAYNFKGFSFRFPHGQKLQDWLIETNQRRGEPWNLLNLGEIGAYRLYDMLALLERSQCLFSIDTATVHLAHASQTPSVVVIPERDYDSPEPRHHWIHRIRGEMTWTPEGRRELETLLFDRTEDDRRALVGRYVRPPHQMYAKHMSYATVATMDAPVEAQRRAGGFRTVTGNLDRYWREVDLMVPVQYLGLDETVETITKISPGEYLVLSRPDMCLTADASRILRAGLKESACVFSGHGHTTDGREGVIPSYEFRHQRPSIDDGVVAFSLAWWRRQKHHLPEQATWEDLWQFCRRVGVPTQGVAAFHDQPQEAIEEHPWQTDTSSSPATTPLPGTV